MKNNSLFLRLIMLPLIGGMTWSSLQAASSFDEKVRQQSNTLLQEWCDALIHYQSNHADKALRGGLFCPSCARIHGRCGDAVLPLMYMADTTKDPKYLDAAVNLIGWMDNVKQHDGSWMNDVHISNWNGTTVFHAIALYEALHHHGHLLNDSIKQVWEGHLLTAGQFIEKNPFIFSRRREGMRNMNVNYSASAPYVLHVVGKMHNRPEMVDLARLIATDMKAYFTEYEGFLFGEGPEIYKKSKNGCFPVDLLYNVEESLPNLLYYAQLVDDKELVDLIEQSLKTHLEFMLPDGAWDNSWGTRSFKWTYWGGRTSDGFMGGYYMLADRNPEFVEAIRRNVALLQQATQKGLLYGGMHYLAEGVQPCIHHTFGHAKALASYLNQPALNVKQKALPRDKEYGVKHFKDINTYLLAEDGWRATVTGFDAEYKVKGTHPMGGVLSLLWHEAVGPIFASTTNRYHLIEAPNMQSIYDPYYTPGSVRLEYQEEGVMYSNLDALDFELSHDAKGKGQHLFTVSAPLVNYDQHAIVDDKVSFSYRFKGDQVIFEAQIPQSLMQKNISLTLPIVATSEQQVEQENGILTVLQGDHKIKLLSSSRMLVAPTLAGRIFNPVPGFAYLPVKVYPDKNGKILAVLTVE